jgi:SAM-dependent methyltransferase
MAEAEFDAVAADYAVQHARSIRMSGEDTGYFAQYKVVEARRVADRNSLDVQRILDFGAGIGSSLPHLREHFPKAHITCLDVSEESLRRCRHLSVERVEYKAYDGQVLPSEIGQFDLIFTACVFHHIETENHISLLSQLRRLLAPNGLFLLFEHNPWNPLTQHAVRICPFDQNAVLISAREMGRRLKIAGFRNVKTDYRIFFPGQLAALRKYEPALAWLPIGAQYSLTAA